MCMKSSFSENWTYCRLRIKMTSLRGSPRSLCFSAVYLIFINLLHLKSKTHFWTSSQSMCSRWKRSSFCSSLDSCCVCCQPLRTRTVPFSSRLTSSYPRPKKSSEQVNFMAKSGKPCYERLEPDFPLLNILRIRLRNLLKKWRRKSYICPSIR